MSTPADLIPRTGLELKRDGCISIPLKIAADPTLPEPAKLVYGCAMSFLGDQARRAMFVARDITKLLGLSERSVRKWLKLLCARGLVHAQNGREGREYFFLGVPDPPPRPVRIQPPQLRREISTDGRIPRRRRRRTPSRADSVPMNERGIPELGIAITPEGRVVGERPETGDERTRRQAYEECFWALPGLIRMEIEEEALRRLRRILGMPEPEVPFHHPRHQRRLWERMTTYEYCRERVVRDWLPQFAPRKDPSGGWLVPDPPRPRLGSDGEPRKDEAGMFKDAVLEPQMNTDGRGWNGR